MEATSLECTTLSSGASLERLTGLNWRVLPLVTWLVTRRGRAGLVTGPGYGGQRVHAGRGKRGSCLPVGLTGSRERLSIWMPAQHIMTLLDSRELSGRSCRL